jgi:hypothetical protein
MTLQIVRNKGILLTFNGHYANKLIKFDKFTFHLQAIHTHPKVFEQFNVFSVLVVGVGSYVTIREVGHVFRMVVCLCVPDINTFPCETRVRLSRNLSRTQNN